MARSRLVEAMVMFRRPSAAPPTRRHRSEHPDTQNMGESAGTGGTLAWGVIARDAPSSSPGPGHGVAHRGRKVSLY